MQARLTVSRDWQSPYGGGRASKLIVGTILNERPQAGSSQSLHYA